MGMFEKFKTADQGVTGGGDTLGGFQVHESDVYQGTVKLIYFGESQSGAQFAEIHMALAAGGEMRERIYMTNRNGENTYKDKTTGDLKFMPGFEMVNDLCLVAIGYDLMQIEQDGGIEEKTVSIWDNDAKKDMPQNVPVLVAALDKPVTAAIMKTKEDKTKKNESTGKYDPTGETRDQNSFAKFFHSETDRTVTEIIKGMDEGVFMQKWLDRNQGKTRDNSKGVQGGGNSGAPGRTGAPGGAKKSSGLFGK